MECPSVQTGIAKQYDGNFPGNVVSGQIRQAVCFNVRFFTRFEDCHFRLHEVMSPCKRASFRQIYRRRFGFCGIVQRMCLCRKLAGLLPACPTSRFLSFDAWRVVWAGKRTYSKGQSTVQPLRLTKAGQDWFLVTDRSTAADSEPESAAAL